MADDIQNLDGKTPIKPVPFDAHEQIVRGPHTHSLEDGYQPAEAADEPEQYPKAVDHVDHPSGVGQEPVVVNDAKEEKAYQQAKADEQKAS